MQLCLIGTKKGYKMAQMDDMEQMSYEESKRQAKERRFVSQYKRKKRKKRKKKNQQSPPKVLLVVNPKSQDVLQKRQPERPQ